MRDLLYKNSKYKNNILLITISEGRYEYRYNNNIIDYFGIDSRIKKYGIYNYCYDYKHEVFVSTYFNHQIFGFRFDYKMK